MMLSKTRFKVNSNKYINKNVQVVLHGSFFSHEGDKTGENATAKKDTESTALYVKVKNA